MIALMYTIIALMLIVFLFVLGLCVKVGIEMQREQREEQEKNYYERYGKMPTPAEWAKFQKESIFL